MAYGIAEPQHFGRARLTDGRRLGWAAWGPAAGRPVRYFAGSALGQSLGFGSDVLPELGVRLIAVERPGLGASDPAPGRTLMSWPRDVAQLCAVLDLQDVRVVGFSQGAPFALSCAATGLPRAVAVVAGTDELAHPELAALLHQRSAVSSQLTADG